MADIATAPGSCDLNKMLNRDWAVQVKRKGSADTEWMFVRGLTSADVAIETSAVDTSDLDSKGWQSDLKTSRSITAALAGNFAVVHGEAKLDASQQLIYETGIELGSEGEIDVRAWRTDGTDEGWEFSGTNTYATTGGDANGVRGWTANIKATCAPKRIKPVLVGGETSESIEWSATPADPQDP